MPAQRDTQFQGFAKALFKELLALSHDQWLEEGIRDADIVNREHELLMARRAYDLVEHTVGYSMEYLDECGREIPGGMKTRIVPSIPDMTELPDEWIVSKVEAFRKLCSPGVTFTDKQKEMIQKRQKEE